MKEWTSANICHSCPIFNKKVSCCVWSLGSCAVSWIEIPVIWFAWSVCYVSQAKATHHKVDEYHTSKYISDKPGGAFLVNVFKVSNPNLFSRRILNLPTGRPSSVGSLSSYKTLPWHKKTSQKFIEKAMSHKLWHSIMIHFHKALKTLKLD